MFRSKKKQQQRGLGDFWSWLAANTERIQSAPGDTTLSGELSRRFEQCYPGLTWEITLSDSGPWTFCVSADGNGELFDRVRAAVADAPPLRGWEVKAFRQRGSLDAEIEMNGQKLGYGDLWCEVRPEASKARVKLYVRGLTPESAQLLLGAALVLLDNAVGERDSVEKISDLDNAPLPPNPARSATFFPLAELPAYFDRLGGPVR